MIVLKIKHFKVKYCEKEQLGESKKNAFIGLNDKNMETVISELFLNNGIQYKKISNIIVPDDTGNIYCDRILKAIRLSLRYKSDIVLMNDLTIIDHSNE